MNLKEYGIDIALLAAGLFGAVLTTGRNAARNLGSTISSLVAGAAAANYLTPVVVQLVKVEGERTQYAIAFLLGFVGLRAVEYASRKLIPHPITDEPEPPHPRKRGR
jgi:uncharacterized membrane protein required for colicin V production